MTVAAARPRAIQGPETTRRFDVVVVGGGFGGLATALALAERGVRVAVCEALSYPGGCASTFARDGFRFESGATLFSGLAPGQLFGDWIERHRLPVSVEWLDPLVELRAPGLALRMPRDREGLLDVFRALPGAPVRGLEAFFREQRMVAATLWELLLDPTLLPPFGLRSLARHAARVPRYLPLLPLLGRPLVTRLRAHGVDRFAPLRLWVDSVCQITNQCPSAEAEAPLALAALDYFFHGTGHVRGGIGSLATALAGAIERLGGAVLLSNRVETIARVGDGWRVASRRGELRAEQVVANVLPRALQTLAPEVAHAPGLGRLAAAVESGWSAAMLYLVARAPAGARPGAHHLELVRDPTGPLLEGNHLFCSISSAADEGRAPAGRRTITVSTHLDVGRRRGLSGTARGEWIASVQERMRETFARLAPEWHAGIEHALTASDRTFERFTRRPEGLVGGVPRRAGLASYRDLFQRPVARGLWLVGDTVFPGQSILATATGGVRLAERVGRAIGLPRR